MFKDVFVASDEEVKIRSKKSSSPDFKPRFDSIDLLRGLVMVLMALDHVRDYFSNVRFDPLDLSQTSVQLFLTRWITHYCAPVFIFLAGTGAFLSMGRGKSKKDVSKFLLSRGLWLIFLEFTLVKLGWTFGFDYSLIVGQVIWVLGCSMVFLSFLIYLPLKTLAVFSIIMILIHNLLDGITPEQFGSFSWLWILFHNFAAIDLGDGYTFFGAYPFIPWIGVMAGGYCFGSLYNLETEKRKKILFWMGIGMIGGFILIRLIDFYGDSNTWTTQKNLVFTILDFINTTKYPPSLLFLLMTLGPAILFLSLLEKIKLNKTNSFFIVFGRVPLLYYLLHIPVIHLLAVLVANATGTDPGFMFGSYPFFWQTEWGYSLPIVYLVWVVVIIGLYPLCFLYNNFKRKKRSKIFSYL
jgi:uncharacterized membrane protein